MTTHVVIETTNYSRRRWKISPKFKHLQDAGHPNLLLSRSAFSDVIFGNKTRVEGVAVPRLDCQGGKVNLHLRCWWILYFWKCICVSNSWCILITGAI